MKKLTILCMLLVTLCVLISCVEPNESQVFQTDTAESIITEETISALATEDTTLVSEDSTAVTEETTTETESDSTEHDTSVSETETTVVTTEETTSLETSLEIQPPPRHTETTSEEQETTSRETEELVTVAKPVIYLYPERETEVSVKLAVDGELTCTYPEYNDGWNVTASPDGTLTDANGQTYNYLYWESRSPAKWDMTRGACIKGEDTAKFLEDALEKLGLDRREANEFIVYWLPIMQENEYNIISFQTDVYTDSAKLDISPAPDTLIRVFMAFKDSETYLELETQELSAPDRAGFTVIEWGGSEVE